jgi:hypothetical protein
MSLSLPHAIDQYYREGRHRFHRVVAAVQLTEFLGDYWQLAVHPTYTSATLQPD